jgi:hypothetical protein
MTAAQDASSGATAVQDVSPATSATPWRHSRFWRRGGFLFAGAAQVITISALVGTAHPVAATWASLLLAIAPVLLAAAAAYLPGRMGWPGTIAAALVILIGIIGAIHQTGVLFIPAFVWLVVGAALQRRELPR